MQIIRLGQANILYHDLIAKASGNPITTGTVNFYLIAKNGDNAGKWFRASDSSWQVAESSAGVGTHKVDGHWYVSIVSAAWIVGVLYEKYAKEGGNLHIAYSENVITDVADVNVTQISGDSTAADNLELQYEGDTGLLGDTFPLRQDQGAGIAGGLAIHIAMVSVTVIAGSEQGLDNANTSDDSRWTGDDDGSGAEFIFRCTPVDTSNIPVDLHFEGYYDEPGAPFNKTATLQIYDFQNSQWDTILIFSNASADEVHDISLSHIHKAPGSGTIETVAYTIGDVLIKFKQDAQETGNACLLIDYMAVGYVGSLVTASEIATALKALTGITAGGTWTWEKMMKIMTAWIAGNWRVKVNESNVQELLDAENGTTVILEQTLTQSPGAGLDYRTITVKI